MATAINVTANGTGVALGGNAAENNKVKAYANFYVETTGPEAALYLHRTPINMASWKLINDRGTLRFQSDYLNSDGEKRSWYDLFSMRFDDGLATLKGNLSLTNGSIDLKRSGGSYISGKTLTNARIYVREKQADYGVRFDPYFSTMTYNSHVFTFGGIGDQIGIYAYKSNRTENGTDYSITLDASSGIFRVNGRRPCDLGANITNGKANETASFWHNQGFGIAGFTLTNQLNSQPAQYGALLNLKNDSKSDLSQLWITQNTGEMYARGMNSTTITAWRRQIDDVNILEWFKCGTGAASGTPTVKKGGIYIQY